MGRSKQLTAPDGSVASVIDIVRTLLLLKAPKKEILIEDLKNDVANAHTLSAEVLREK